MGKLDLLGWRGRAWWQCQKCLSPLSLQRCWKSPIPINPPPPIQVLKTPTLIPRSVFGSAPRGLPSACQLKRRRPYTYTCIQFKRFHPNIYILCYTPFDWIGSKHNSSIVNRKRLLCHSFHINIWISFFSFDHFETFFASEFVKPGLI